VFDIHFVRVYYSYIDNETTERNQMKIRFPIGLTFVYYADKQKRERTITDIFTTTNSKGVVVRIEYEAMHKFCGQDMKENFGDTAIARSLGNEEIKKYN
jgi:hypothetical protein